MSNVFTLPLQVSTETRAVPLSREEIAKVVAIGTHLAHQHGAMEAAAFLLDLYQRWMVAPKLGGRSQGSNTGGPGRSPAPETFTKETP